MYYINQIMHSKVYKAFYVKCDFLSLKTCFCRYVLNNLIETLLNRIFLYGKLLFPPANLKKKKVFVLNNHSQSP